MRMLMKVQIPTPAGNDAIREGVLPGVMRAATESLGAEAVYFTAEEGMRTALIFFEMRDASSIPPAAEPFFMAAAGQDHPGPGDEPRRDAVGCRARDGPGVHGGLASPRQLASTPMSIGARGPRRPDPHPSRGAEPYSRGSVEKSG